MSCRLCDIHYSPYLIYINVQIGPNRYTRVHDSGTFSLFGVLLGWPSLAAVMRGQAARSWDSFARQRGIRFWEQAYDTTRFL
jgi:hypothetical protein